MQAINTFHIRYVTSDKAEYQKLHAQDPHVLYVNRDKSQYGMGWDCDVLKGTMGTYAVATGNAEEDDFVRACSGGPCGCVVCRESTLYRPQFLNTDKSESGRCRCDDLTGGWNCHTLTYTSPGVLVTATKKRRELAAKNFAGSIKPGTPLLLGVSEIKNGYSTVEEPYTVVLATKKAYTTTQRLSKGGVGVGAVIQKNTRVVNITPNIKHFILQ